MKKYYSQFGQDNWVCDFFKYKTDGYFLDIGAYDGIEFSNTYYLEQQLGWTGICVEASSLNFNKLMQANRSCIRLHNAVYKQNKIVKFPAAGGLGAGLTIGVNQATEDVQALTLKTILKDNNSPKLIDYVSLDIEGFEYEALLGFPFKEYEVIMWTVEHNLYNTCAETIMLKANVLNIMTKNGYKLVKENVGSSPLWPAEDWYINAKYI